MSHFVVDKHVALRYPETELRQAYDTWRLAGDRFILFELGGDNNISTKHPINKRDVRRRRWSVSAIGAHGDCMAVATRLAIGCCNGGLRLEGERETKPESFIHRCRKALDNALDFRVFYAKTNIHLGLSFRMDSGEWEEAADVLVRHLGAPAEDGWAIDYRNLQQVALMMAYRHADKRDAWEMASADGPSFACHAPAGFF